jgi:hypothetical protein
LISATGAVTGSTLTAGGFTLTGNSIVSANTTITIDPAGPSSTNGVVIIQGNLQVEGTTTTINSNVITTNDLLFNLANNAATAAAANGGGIGVGPVGTEYATLTYNSTSNVWVATNGLSTPGTLSATGNITGGNILGTGVFKGGVSVLNANDTIDGGIY